MKVKLKNVTPASIDSLQSLQVAIGRPLSDSFTRFVREHDGAVPESNIVKVTEGVESGVRGFIPVSMIMAVHRNIDNIPGTAYPIAQDDCGNYFFIDEGKGGAVFFWDHEVPDLPVQLAPNFGAFLDLLEPFDTSQVKVQPGQVKRVWVDPEFLKKLKKDH